MMTGDEFYDDDVTSGFPVDHPRDFDRHPRTAPYLDPFPCDCPPVADCPHGAEIDAWMLRHPYETDTRR